jgi:hypothetical protein
MESSDANIKLFASKPRVRQNRSNKAQSMRLKTSMAKAKNGKPSDAQMWRLYNAQTIPMLAPSMQPSNHDIIVSLKEIIQSLHQAPVRTTTTQAKETLEKLDKTLDVKDEDMVDEIISVDDAMAVDDGYKNRRYNKLQDEAAKILQGYTRAKIDANDMQPAIVKGIKEEKAATKIQKMLKGRKVRKDYEEFKDTISKVPPEIKDRLHLKATGNFVEPIRSRLRPLKEAEAKKEKDELVSLIKTKQKEAKKELISLIETKQKEAEQAAKAGRPKLSRAERVGNAIMREHMAATSEVSKPVSSPGIMSRLRSAGEYINGIWVSKPVQQPEQSPQSSPAKSNSSAGSPAAKTNKKKRKGKK